MDYRYNQNQPPAAPWQPNLWYAPIRRSSNIICLGMVLVFLLGFLLAPVFTMLADFYIETFGIMSIAALSFIDVLCDFLISAVMFIVPLTIIRLWIGIPSKVAFPMRRGRASITVPAVFICLGVSVAGMLASGIISAFLELLFGVTPYMPSMPNPIGIPAVSLYIIRMTVFPAVVEELMFRGVIMQSLRRFGDGFALICSSILFAFAHYNLYQGPNALIAGLVIGFFVLRTGSLRTGIIAHFINNAVAVTVSLVSVDMADSTKITINMLIIASYILLGMVGGIMLMINHAGIFRLAPPDYPVAEKTKYTLFFIGVMSIIYMLIVLVTTIRQLA